MPSETLAPRQFAACPPPFKSVVQVKCVVCPFCHAEVCCLVPGFNPRFVPPFDGS